MFWLNLPKLFLLSTAIMTEMNFIDMVLRVLSELYKLPMLFLSLSYRIPIHYGLKKAAVLQCTLKHFCIIIRIHIAYQYRWFTEFIFEPTA